jgi:hypothetical protein
MSFTLPTLLSTCQATIAPPLRDKNHRHCADKKRPMTRAARIEELLYSVFCILFSVSREFCNFSETGRVT